MPDSACSPAAHSLGWQWPQSRSSRSPRREQPRPLRVDHSMSLVDRLPAGTVAVVVSVDRSHALHLDGVNPVTDTVLWQHPYSASAITPGIALTPAAAGATVADIVPAGELRPRPPSSSTASMPRRGPSSGSCPRHSSFRTIPLPAWEARISVFRPTPPMAQPNSHVIDAATGRPASVLSGPSRALGTDLYQSSNETPTLDQLSAGGAIAWSEPVTTVFGPGYDPGMGWNISPIGGLNVGSVGLEMDGTTADLSRYKTVGFSTATGSPQWSIPGSYQCMGPLVFLSTPVACQYKGTVHESKASTRAASLRGVTLTLGRLRSDDGIYHLVLPGQRCTRPHQRQRRAVRR